MVQRPKPVPLPYGLSPSVHMAQPGVLRYARYVGMDGRLVREVFLGQMSDPKGSASGLSRASEVVLVSSGYLPSMCLSKRKPFR